MGDFVDICKLNWESDPFWVEDALNDINLLLIIHGKAEVGFLLKKEDVEEKLLTTVNSTVAIVFKKIISNGMLGYQMLNNIKLQVSQIVSEEIARKIKEFHVALISFDITEIQISGDDYIRRIEAEKRAEMRRQSGITWQEEQKIRHFSAECDSNAAETILCNQCGKTVPKNRFCIECGNKLMA